MANYKIKTKLFGELEVSKEEGLFKDYDIVLGSKEMTVELYIMEDFLGDDNIKQVMDMLDHIPEMYMKGRKAISEGKDSNAFIKYFIEDQINELDWIGEIFGVDSNDEISPAMFVEKLEPRAIRVGPNKDNMIDCTFDFSLPEEYSDELLVVCFDDQYEIYDITHES